MVSMNPSSPEGFYVDTNAAALPGINPFPPAISTASDAAVSPPMDDSNSKKIRKPYTITKSRESWTEPEHDKFLEALQLFDRDWKKIEAFIGSKTVIQIRSHAQKYFLKVQKSGSNEHLPPPRPKRKAAHPYPQKAPKNATSTPQATGSLQASLLEPGLQRPETAPIPRYPNSAAVLSSWATNSQTVGAPSTAKSDAKTSVPPGSNNCSSSTESIAMAHTAGEANEVVKHPPPLRVLPDFAQVYNFIGSVFDPEVSGHLQRLKKMDPIDVETLLLGEGGSRVGFTIVGISSVRHSVYFHDEYFGGLILWQVLLLMRNLSINLTSPDFEDHRKLLSSYDNDIDKPISGGMNDIVCAD